jgi:hypothetical protein
MMDQQNAAWRKRFAHHKATWDGRALRWAKPGTIANSITYILEGCYLTVLGDLGEAVYRWSENLTLDFLQGCSADYMLGKCKASEVGYEFTSWDEQAARTWAKGAQKQRLDEYPDTKMPKWILELQDSDGSQESFAEIASQQYNRSSDSEIASAIRQAGLAPHPRFVAQYVGLQIAIEQIPTIATVLEEAT